MLRSWANEIPELIRHLGSRKPTCADAARARLSIIGPRAVDDLIEALEGENHRVRARIMPILALIQDPRGRGPMIAMLLDRNSRLREIAARCLGRFPTNESVAALNRVLDRERSEKARRRRLGYYEFSCELTVSHQRVTTGVDRSLLCAAQQDGDGAFVQNVRKVGTPAIYRELGERLFLADFCLSLSATCLALNDSS